MSTGSSLPPSLSSVSTPGSATSVEEALRLSQVENERLSSAQMEFQATIASLKVEKHGGSFKDRLAAAVDAVSPGLVETVDTLAKIQAVMHEFRLPDKGVFLRPPPNIDINSEARFDDYDAGTTQHIWEMLKDYPEARDAMVRLPAFGDLWRKRHQSQAHYNLLHAKEFATDILRAEFRHLKSIADGKTVDDLAALIQGPESAHENCTQFRILLSTPGTLDYPNSQLPLILYRNLSGEPSDFLMTPALARLARSITWRKQAMGEQWTSAPYKRCVGYIWKIQEVTPGLVAHCVVILIFLVSGDKELSTTHGSRTKFSYMEIYRDCKKLLTVGANTEPVKRIMKEFTHHFFIGTTVQYKTDNNSSSSLSANALISHPATPARGFSNFVFEQSSPADNSHSIAIRSTTPTASDSGEEFDFAAAGAEFDNHASDSDTGSVPTSNAPPIPATSSSNKPLSMTGHFTGLSINANNASSTAHVCAPASAAGTVVVPGRGLADIDEEPAVVESNPKLLTEREGLDGRTVHGVVSQSTGGPKKKVAKAKKATGGGRAHNKDVTDTSNTTEDQVSSSGTRRRSTRQASAK